MGTLAVLHFEDIPLGLLLIHYFRQPGAILNPDPMECQDIK